MDKEFFSGIEEPVYSKQNRRRSYFDKSTVIPDTDKSCAKCIFSKYLIADKKKGIVYGCQKKPDYVFYSYWKQTQARDCSFYTPESSPTVTNTGR